MLTKKTNRSKLGYNILYILEKQAFIKRKKKVTKREHQHTPHTTKNIQNHAHTSNKNIYIKKRKF